MQKKDISKSSALYPGCRLMSPNAVVCFKVLMMKVGLEKDLVHEVAQFREEEWEWEQRECCQWFTIRDREAWVHEMEVESIPYGAYGGVLKGNTIGSVGLKITKSVKDNRGPGGSLDTGVYKIGWVAENTFFNPLQYCYDTSSSVFLNEKAQLSTDVYGVPCAPLPNPLVVVITVTEATITFHIAGREPITTHLPDRSPGKLVVFLNRCDDAAQVLSPTDPLLDFYFARDGDASPPSSPLSPSSLSNSPLSSKVTKARGKMKALTRTYLKAMTYMFGGVSVF
eukprot:TRINITY_DN388_c3_g1_i1.p1 TRINITY_DN388_c3_g1~~TRINITY_DN388_c3_g1_i1.p1  ORF type:complete len:308 (+),score=39.47 TRINITY_DN388_c3_g1_i1:80-925(+)